MARHFKHWLRSYCEFTSTSEAPLEFHFWTGVSTIAGALRRRVWKDENYFKWTPNFYIIFVGPAGVVTKSTTLNIGYQMLRKVQGVYFGPDSMTWHGLATRFEGALEYVKWTIAGKDQEPFIMSPLTCSVSELGTFLRPDDKNLVSFLTDVWDGKERPFEHVTKTSGEIKIENAWLNIIGATTPEWMQSNFPASLLSEGIGSRIVFVYAEQKRHLVAYPSRLQPKTNFKDDEKKLIDDLNHIALMSGPYELTEDAYAWGEAWYKKHHEKRGTHMASGRYGGYLARKQTHMHKLAMVLAACQRDTLRIDVADLQDAEKILLNAEQSMIKVFESVGIVDEAKHVAEITAFVRAYGFIEVKELYRLCHNIMAEKDFKQALRLSIDGELLEIVAQKGVRGVAPKHRTSH